jgi:CheY-like chemotaxis protein
MTRPGQRTEADLTRMQLEAVEAWHRARRAAEDAAAVRTASREARMDVTRRLEVLREQHRAIVERTEHHLQASVHLLARSVPPRAVIVHRNEWFVRKLADELGSHEVEVVGVLENGAQGVGVVVAEQPDLLLVEDTLPMVAGEEVVRETRRFSPSTLVVAQVAYEDRIPALLDAGARAAYTRRVPPGEVARQLLGLLQGGDLVHS